VLEKSVAQNGKNAHQIGSALLDLNKVPRIVGEGPRRLLQEALTLLERTTVPLYLIGDSGTGKSAIGKAIAKGYAINHNVPAYYFQLSPEDTKTTVLLGYRLINGSLEVVPGLLSQAAEEGAVVFIDEITHSTQQMLLLLNALDGKESVISIGEKAIDASRLRIIYGSNTSIYAGNIRIPPSFANRVIAIPFVYPSFEDEIAISLSIAEKNYLGSEISIPISVVKYIVSYIRENRTPTWPLSPRNVANSILQLQLAKRSGKPDHIDSYFTTGANVESIRKKITQRILATEIKDVTVMQRPEILEFINYVSGVGVGTFRECILRSIGYYVDIDGVELSSASHKQILYSSIL
jgi:MoxR-like ATPase